MLLVVPLAHDKRPSEGGSERTGGVVLCGAKAYKGQGNWKGGAGRALPDVDWSGPDAVEDRRGGRGCRGAGGWIPFQQDEDQKKRRRDGAPKGQVTFCTPKGQVTLCTPASGWRLSVTSAMATPIGALLQMASNIHAVLCHRSIGPATRNTNRNTINAPHMAPW